MQAISMLADIGTFLAAIAAFVGIVIGVRTYRRQMNAQLFLTLTQRYEEIMGSFPDHAYEARFCAECDLPPSSRALTLSMLRYLKLCSEEFYLWKNGYLDDRLWRIWETELKRALRSPLVRREWPELQSEFESYSAFRAYVETVQRKPLPGVRKETAA